LRVEAGHFFNDDRPVAIIAQQSHLRRILEVVAAKTLRRDFIGVVVPEKGEADSDGFVPRLVSRVVLWGISTDTPGAVEIAHRRAVAIWRIVNVVRRFVMSPVPYKTEADGKA
jgi:hypothetical protein